MNFFFFFQSKSTERVLSLENLKTLMLVQLKSIFFLFAEICQRIEYTCQSFGFLNSGFMPETNLGANKIMQK